MEKNEVETKLRVIEEWIRCIFRDMERNADVHEAMALIRAREALVDAIMTDA